MALLNFVALALCFIIVAGEPYHAHASRHGILKGRKNIFGAQDGLKDSKTIFAAETSTEDGLCASSITVHGYKCQEHEVTTPDGYIISLQRIPEGRAEARGHVTKKEPVIVQHGIMVDGMSWLMNTPENNLPMILADNGYDVWVSNSRGTRYSRRHTTLDPSSDDFWQWSWDEMVKYDLPAIFDYVSNQTGQKIHYVGHSLGTLVPLAAFSEGKLVNQLKSAALLSPIAYLSHMTTAIGVAAARFFAGEAFDVFGIAEFDPKGTQAIEFFRRICDTPGVDCKDLFTAFTGDNCCLNPTVVDKFLRNEPQSTSIMNLIHLSQTVRTGVLSKYEYRRPSQNLKQYRNLNPPVYNLSNIPHDLPLFMSYGGKDALSDVPDVKNLLDQIKSHDKDKLTVQYIKEYAHADYMMGDNVKDKVVNDVIAFFKRHSHH